MEHKKIGNFTVSKVKFSSNSFEGYCIIHNETVRIWIKWTISPQRTREGTQRFI